MLAEVLLWKFYSCTNNSKKNDELPNLEINITAAPEHVGEIEHVICTIKERSHGVVSYQLYVVLPKPMVIHLVYFAVLWLNNKPNILGISQIHLPREIVTKRKIDWEKQIRIGDYVQGNYERNITNQVRDMYTYNGIYLGPTDNRQGNVNLFDLETCTVKKPHTIFSFPVPDIII